MSTAANLQADKTNAKETNMEGLLIGPGQTRIIKITGRCSSSFAGRVSSMVTGVTLSLAFAVVGAILGIAIQI